MNVTDELAGEVPHFQRYGVGHNCMLKIDSGSWVHVDDVSNLLDWILDDGRGYDNALDKAIGIIKEHFKGE